MIEIKRYPEKSQLLCKRCGHSEDDHNWQNGPCNVQSWKVSPHDTIAHCICYAFVSPLGEEYGTE